MKKHEVPIKKLRITFNEKKLSFKNTSEIETDPNPFGQKRAIDALKFGLRVKTKSFNIYVTGPSGTGKTSIIKKVVNQYAKTESVSNDIIYVNSFDDSSRPISIIFPKGKGGDFKKDIEIFIKDLKGDIPKKMESPKTAEKKSNIIKKYQDIEKKLHQEITEFTEKQDFVLQRTQTGIMAQPLVEDKPITEETFAKLTDEEKKDIERRQTLVQEKMDFAGKEEAKNEKAFKKEMESFEAEIINKLLKPLIQEIKANYRGNKKIATYLNSLKDDILKNSQAFLIKPEQIAQNPKLQQFIDFVFSQYQINLFVDRSKEEFAPVIFERNPTFNNLFGWIEHEEKNGYLTTDFTKIKSGAIHKANGGYLIMQVADLIKNNLSYDELIRSLRSKTTKVGENPYSAYSLKPLKKMEPEEIELDIKVILIGSSHYFSILNRYDEEFSRLFKVKADFDHFVKRDDENLEQFLQFLSLKAKEKEIMPLNRTAVAEIIDFSTRIAGQYNRLTAQLSILEDILVEAHYIAFDDNKRVISREYIEKAIDKRKYRNGKIKGLIQDSIYEGSVMIDVKGEKVGEINGLAVYSLENFSFGVPTKITAQTYAGSRGVINIEREANLSGSIHNKGIAILTGYLGNLFRNITPLNLNASISFEQNYGGVDGDSASSTETYAILSSLSGYPLKQTIAVTGSVNQMGIIQPIGGVNDKIEGFFDICSELTELNGEHGVIIPIQNVKNLMLRKDVIQAVKDNKFHIYAVSTIQEGIEILTGKKFGKLTKDGFTKNSILDKAYHQLMEFVAQNIDIKKTSYNVTGRKEEKKSEKEKKEK